MNETNPTQPPSPSNPSRMLAIGVAGCLILCCLAVLCGGAFVVLHQVQSSSAAGFLPFAFGSTPTGPTPPVAPAQADTLTPADAPTQAAAAESTLQAPPSKYPHANRNAMGNVEASVKIIEYADFQCPYCKSFFMGTEKQLLDAYISTGKVYYEFHLMGAFIGPESARAAEAAYCAADQNMFWEMRDMIFDHQAGENSGAFSDDNLLAFASGLGLDMGAFKDCFAGGKYAAAVKQEGLDAAKAGVKGTPSFLINSTLVEGALPFSAFQAIIEPLLKKNPSG